MKRLLLIGINFYSYIAEIKGAMARQGYEVDYYPIEDTSFWSKTEKRLSGNTYQTRLNNYHARVIRETAEIKYDVVMFIQVHHFAFENIVDLKNSQPSARFVLYNWDSVSTHDYRPYIQYFNYVATFDPKDATELAIGYLPLFAVPAYFEIRKDKPADFDIYFVGTIGTMHRFNALRRLHDFCDAKGIRTKFHLKCNAGARLMLLRNHAHMPGVTSKSLTFGEIIELMERSTASFDFANHKQTGYTMRFIENMCAGRKIITENARVLDESFYRPDRFLVVQNYDFSGVRAFLDMPITSDLDVSEYSVDRWVSNLLEKQ